MTNDPYSVIMAVVVVMGLITYLGFAAKGVAASGSAYGRKSSGVANLLWLAAVGVLFAGGLHVAGIIELPL